MVLQCTGTGSMALNSAADLPPRQPGVQREDGPVRLAAERGVQGGGGALGACSATGAGGGQFIAF